LTTTRAVMSARWPEKVPVEEAVPVIDCETPHE
jgi:hypothetical protein